MYNTSITTRQPTNPALCLVKSNTHIISYYYVINVMINNNFIVLWWYRIISDVDFNDV